MVDMWGLVRPGDSTQLKGYVACVFFGGVVYKTPHCMVQNLDLTFKEAGR